MTEGGLVLAIHIIRIRFDDVMVRRKPVKSVVGHVARKKKGIVEGFRQIAHVLFQARAGIGQRQTDARF